MGSCNSMSKTKNSIRPKFMQSFDKREFPRVGTVKIKKRNHIGKVTGTHDLTFELTEPKLVISKLLNLGNQQVWASACILPGLDPHKEQDKKCQDCCLFLCDGDSIFLAEFDGHGTYGEKVVDFCSSIVQREYNSSKFIYQSNPSSFLTNVTLKCDEDIRKPSSGIDVSQSGSTEVLCLIYNNTVFSASVGDSRAVLSTTCPPLHPPAPQAVLGKERQLLEEANKRRNSIANPLIHPVQLTRDQKPEDPDELARIYQAGGRVQRLIDKNGNKIGPYRVWEMNSNSPGLAMSRSIGDSVGTRLGVVANPITTVHRMSVDDDCFIIAASDGVWDVFENKDAINFVEYYRNKCKRGMTERPVADKISSDNTCIAQLLCEEARMRWYTIVEEEEVIIDDISCVIIEFRSESVDVARESGDLPDANGNQGEDAGTHQLKRAPTTHDVQTRDPRRGSVVVDRFENE